jgi:hypothetical protein
VQFLHERIITASFVKITSIQRRIQKENEKGKYQAASKGA